MNTDGHGFAAYCRATPPHHCKGNAVNLKPNPCPPPLPISAFFSISAFAPVVSSFQLPFLGSTKRSAERPANGSQATPCAVLPILRPLEILVPSPCPSRSRFPSTRLQDEFAERLARRLFAPNGLGACQEIRARRRSGWHHRGDHFVLLRHLHFFPSGNPAQNLRPLLWQLLNRGSLHRGKMPRNGLRRKLAFALRALVPPTVGSSLRVVELAGWGLRCNSTVPR